MSSHCSFLTVHFSMFTFNWPFLAYKFSLFYSYCLSLHKVLDDTVHQGLMVFCQLSALIGRSNKMCLCSIQWNQINKWDRVLKKTNRTNKCIKTVHIWNSLKRTLWLILEWKVDCWLNCWSNIGRKNKVLPAVLTNR